jgi:hypothetical protein
MCHFELQCLSSRNVEPQCHFEQSEKSCTTGAAQKDFSLTVEMTWGELVEMTWIKLVEMT